MILSIAASGAVTARAASQAASDTRTVSRAAPVSIVAGSSAPLTALSITSGAVTCVQSGAAVDADGAMGVLAPQLGATVIRGSAATSPSVAWVVVPRERAGADASALTTVCIPAR